LAKYNLTDFNFNDGNMEDSKPLNKLNVPAYRNLVNETSNNEYYFTYHHSVGDSVSILNSDMMDQNVAAIAALAYLISN